jgi:sugar-specific transcriptional regulator TrmB
MKQVNEYLKQLGLSDIESKLYLGLLETGSTTVMELANHVGIKRITAHFNVENLIQKGLVTETRKGARRQIVAEDPEKLQVLLDEKEISLRQLKNILPNVIQTITRELPKKSQTAEDVNVRYYEGKKGVKTIYEEVLSAQEVRSYVNLDKVYGIFPENVELFMTAMKENKDLKIWEIVEKSNTAERNTGMWAQSDQYRFKFAPENLHLYAADVMIYDGKVAVVNVTENASGVIFVNKDFYETSKNIFDFLWGIIKE